MQNEEQSCHLLSQSNNYPQYFQLINKQLSSDSLVENIKPSLITFHLTKSYFLRIFLHSATLCKKLHLKYFVLFSLILCVIKTDRGKPIKSSLKIPFFLKKVIL